MNRMETVKIRRTSKNRTSSQKSDNDGPKATVAKKGETVTVEDILRDAQIDIDDPDIIAAFGVESKKSAF